MTAPVIWNGRGEAGDAVTFELRNGRIVGQPVLGDRVRTKMRWLFRRNLVTMAQVDRAFALANDAAFLAPYNGMLVSALAKIIVRRARGFE